MISNSERLSPQALENKRARDRRYHIEHKEEARAWYKEYHKKNREKIIARANKWNASHPERTIEIKRKSWLKRKYGLTPSEFKDMLSRQHNRCAICSTRFYKSCTVDHCHITDRIRGLLCRRCNSRLGTFENSLWHKAATEYLRRS